MIFKGTGSRKSLFLHSTILRSRRLKDGDEQGGGTGDGIEIGAGFAVAAERAGSDDTRTAEPDAGSQEGSGDQNDDAGGDDNGSDDQGGENDAGDNSDGEAKTEKKRRPTAEYIRDLKRELRAEKEARAAERESLEQRLARLEQGGLTAKKDGDNSTDTSDAAPDPNDAEKYPLGVLDDGYLNDVIEWKTDQKVKAALDGRLRAEREQEAQTAQQTQLLEKVDAISAAAAETDQFPDFDELVIKGGLANDWELTEITFTAATEAANGPAILYALAKDPVEALRVSKLSAYQQVSYVRDKDAEITANKPKPRKIPKAGDPPATAPSGRSGSSPIRGDTDDLNDFRKLFYGPKGRPR